MNARFWRTLHRWLGWALGLQFVLWTASGLTMSVLAHDLVDGSRFRTPTTQTPVPADLVEPSAVLAAAGEGVESIELVQLAGRAAYRVRAGSSTQLFDARSGAPTLVDAAWARAIAQADYAGPAQLGRVQRMQAPALEVRRHTGPVWQVSIEDAEHSTLYIDADDGRVLERRNDTWRVFDVFWMLHTMDYAGRDDFNNAQVVIVAAGVLWLALSGIFLVGQGLARDVRSARARRAASTGA